MIPHVANSLGLSAQSYYNIATNVNRMTNMSAEQREEIIEKAKKNLSARLSSPLQELRDELMMDRITLNRAGIDYSNPPSGDNFFITAILDYVLRNPTCIKS